MPETRNPLLAALLALGACATCPSGEAAEPRFAQGSEAAQTDCPNAGAEGCRENHFTAQKMKQRLLRQQRDERLDEGRKAFIERQN